MAIEKSADHSNIETLTGADSVDATTEARAKSALASDNILEHQQTVLQVFCGHPVLIWWAFFFSVSAIRWGFDAQVNGALLSIPAFRRDFGEQFDGDFVVPAPWLSAFNSISSVGQFFGGFLCSAIADRVGRRLALAVSVQLILGVGLGFYLTIEPLYSSEVSPVVLRGITTAGVNLGIVIGQFLSNAAIKGFGERGDRWAYRGPFAIQFFFVAFLGLGLPFSVESPWYLVRHNRIGDARNALQRLYGPDTDVETKLVAIRMTVAQDLAATQSKWFDAHLVGIIFVLGFSAYFFQLAGLPTERGASWTQAALTVVWAFYYQVSIGASPSLRAKATAMATATQAVFGIVMNIIIPYMVNPDEGNTQGKVGFVFKELGAIVTVLCCLYIPDLKDRTFEEIDLMFENRVPPRRMESYVIER
ncbi:hypothetical protein BDW72DRAFT_208690 [Aspergillus terricola var. indicus]